MSFGNKSRFRQRVESPARFSSNDPAPGKVDNSYLFAHDSTTRLIKKFFMYKLMGSNLFIDYSLGMMKLAYKLLGVRATNWIVHNTVGDILTGG